MSLVIPLPHPPRYPLSRSSTPGAGSPTPPSSTRLHSRPATPPPALHSSFLAGSLHTISAPPTPVNTTHIVPLPPAPGTHSSGLPFTAPGMERCRSSEAVLISHHDAVHRDAAARKDKLQPLLYNIHPATTPTLAEPQPESPALTEGKIDERTADAEDEKMDIDDIEIAVPELGPPTSDDHVIWGMPKWGLEDERREVRPGVRLVGMEELPPLVERHALLDTPSQVLFPWLHGISDDGVKGREMGAFFGFYPPFEPPPYRGLTLVLAPPHPLDRESLAPPTDVPHTSDNPSNNAAHLELPPIRERSETISSSSESHHSSEPADATSPSTTAESSLGPETPRSPVSRLNDGLIVDSNDHESDETDSGPETEVAMHPCESKRVSPRAAADGLDSPPDIVPSDSTDSDTESLISEDEPRPSCILVNTLHAQDIFEFPQYPNVSGKRSSYVHIPKTQDGKPAAARFRPARLPNQINLRNLHIQQIKYATISDIVLYARNGVGPGVLEIAESIAQAQEALYKQRMEEFYGHMAGRGEGEGLDRPVRYGVWVLVEPFTKVERFCPDLVNIDSAGNGTDTSHLLDLFEREAYESRAMTRGSEVVEGFWVGNDCDVPGGADDGTGAQVPFDLCVKASECSDMPSSASLAAAYRSLVSLDRRRPTQNSTSDSWSASPATLALRNLLSPSSPPTPLLPASDSKTGFLDESAGFAALHAAEHHYVSIECAGSCRTITGQMRNLANMTEKVIELISFLRKVVEGRDKTGIRRLVLVHCQDGYTESSIIVLSYIMASLGVTLPEAYLHLQVVAKRSFFLYPTDKPLLRRIEARLAQDRRDRAIKCVRSGGTTSSTTTHGPSQSITGMTRWKPWGFMRNSDDKRAADREDHSPSSHTSDPPQQSGEPQPVDVARRLLVDEGQGGSQASLEAKVWFEDKRFDGFPSRILPFLYLGNLEHAGNAAMLRSLGITHVVSVGESLLVPGEHDPTHGFVGTNSLAAEARAGRIQVLDLTDVRDDGNDPLRPVIARACEWMERARAAGGSVLVHCRVGVSRSASIVMAYLMQYRHMGLMDAYLMTRARRLNVLIQPNLRFFHELFGWEAELARCEAESRAARRLEAEHLGVRDPTALASLDSDPTSRRILYTWPTFCRDVHCLNRRFLCN